MRPSLGSTCDDAQPGAGSRPRTVGPCVSCTSASRPTSSTTSRAGPPSARCTPRSSTAPCPTPRCCSSTPPVYTAGKRTEPHERPTDGTPVIDVDRGGKITWHGPGQLVGYPIVRLTEVPIDVVAHVRRLEEVMIRVCRDFGVETVRVDGRSGVWVLADDRGPDRKLGAIGVRVSRRVTMHGFALNCDADLSWADAIIPCGIADAGVSLADPRGRRPVTVQDVLPYAEKHLDDVLG